MSRVLPIFTRNIASSWLSLVLTTACQLIMVPVALDALGKADFALYAVISQMLMVIMLAELGVSSACSRLLIEAHAKSKDAYRKMWTATTMMFGAQAIIILSLTMAISPFVGTALNLDENQSKTAVQIFMLVGLINAVNYGLSCVSSCLYAGQELAGLNLISIFSQITQLIAFCAFLSKGSGLWSYPFALMCSGVVFHFGCIVLALKRELLSLPRISQLDWNCVKSTFRLGLDVFAAALFSMAMGHSLLIFSGRILTMEEIASLAVHLKLVNLLINILQRIPGSADPMYMKMASEGNLQHFRTWWKAITKFTLGLALTAGGCFIIGCNHLIEFWVGPELLLPSITVAALALIPARFLIHYTLVTELAVFKEVGRVKWLMLWEVALYTALAFMLGNAFGITGLVTSNLLSMLGGSLIGGLYWFSRCSKIRRSELVGLVVKSTLPFIIIFLLLRSTALDDMGTSMVTSLIYVAVWLACASLTIYLAIMTKDERKLVALRLKSFAANRFLRS